MPSIEGFWYLIRHANHLFGWGAKLTSPLNGDGNTLIRHDMATDMKTILFALKSFKVATTLMVVVSLYALVIWVEDGSFANDFAITTILTCIIAGSVWLLVALTSSFIDYFKD